MKHFVQFYTTMDYLFDDNHKFVNFQNGLSHVWDSIERKGWQLHWVKDKPPITKGELYASCWHTNEVEMVRKWDREYPELNAYVCGPIVLHYGMNVKSIRGDAEDIFFDGQTSEWKIDIPKIDEPIGYAVSITKGTGCYWGNCTYCKVESEPRYRNIESVPIIDHPYHKYIWLHTFSMPSQIMEKLYPTFPDRNDVTYMTYVRADRQTVDTYKKVKLKVDPKYLAFDIGIEFPSNRMLEYIKKGATVSDYLDFIQLAKESRLHFNFMLHWNNLTEKDIDNAKYFFDHLIEITDGSNITANIYPLIVIGDKEIYSNYRPDEMSFRRKSIWDIELNIDLYDLKLTNEQIRLNKKAKNVINSFPFLKLHDWSVL